MPLCVFSSRHTQSAVLRLKGCAVGTVLAFRTRSAYRGLVKAVMVVPGTNLHQQRANIANAIVSEQALPVNKLRRAKKCSKCTR